MGITSLKNLDKAVYVINGKTPHSSFTSARNFVDLTVNALHTSSRMMSRLNVLTLLVVVLPLKFPFELLFSSLSPC